MNSGRLRPAAGDRFFSLPISFARCASAARFRDKILLQWAGAPESGGVWRLLLEMANSWRRPRFPLTGHDAMQAGAPEGPEVGRVLTAVEDWWVEGDFAADEGALRDRLKAVIGQI